MFKVDWFRRFTQDPDSFTINGKPVKKSECTRYATVDLAIGTNANNDYTVVAKWALHRGNLLLIDLIRKRIDGTRIVPTIQQATKDCQFVAVEDVAFQRMALDQLRAANVPVKRFKPEGDKESRSITAQILAESGRVFLPEGESFVADFLAEIGAFPFGKHDDQLDALS